MDLRSLARHHSHHDRTIYLCARHIRATFQRRVTKQKERERARSLSHRHHSSPSLLFNFFSRIFFRARLERIDSIDSSRRQSRDRNDRIAQIAVDRCRPHSSSRRADANVRPNETRRVEFDPEIRSYVKKRRDRAVSGKRPPAKAAANICEILRPAETNRLALRSAYCCRA